MTTDCFRILIVDDAQTTRRATRLMLAQIANTKVVATAANGQEAIDLAQQLAPDIALVDIHMPDVNGLQAIRSMLHYHPHMACIIISVERDRRIMAQAMEAGARGYLVKPFTIEQLKQTIESVREPVRRNQERQAQFRKLMAQRDAYLRELAQEYIQTRRVDRKALAVFEQLAKDPACELYFLQTLAVLYVFRRDWPKLGKLAVRIAKQQQSQQAQQNAL